MSENFDFVKDITKMSEDFDQWYTDVIRKAEMADYSGVRGSMVIRPYGFAIWEAIQRAFDDMIKSSGHENWYFPMLIPEPIFSQEAEHVEGFAPEVAWVNYVGSRPAKKPPTEWTDDERRHMAEGWLSQPLVIRPTSETIIGSIMRRYIQSHRDLPQLTNQWCNVVRWEMRTRLFLRTAEFLWQEGHTFHAFAEEAQEEVDRILEYYRAISEDWLAMPVLLGRKSPAETFAGAVYSRSIEALMRDGRALQSGTSHFLGQNFSRAYDISFANRENQREHCWTTSWGISTRLVGAVVMAHGDDSGLVLPPKVAPVQVVVVPIFRDENSRREVGDFLEPLTRELGQSARVRVDWRADVRPGEKYAHWELKGVPLRLEVGPRDVAAGQAVLVDRLNRERRPVPAAGLAARLTQELDSFQQRLFERALKFREDHTWLAQTLGELVERFRTDDGFVLADWCGDEACEQKVKEETGGVTLRNYPDTPVAAQTAGTCAVCGRGAKVRAAFARAY